MVGGREASRSASPADVDPGLGPEFAVNQGRGEADQHASDSNVPYTILQILAGSGDGVNVGWRLQGLNVIRLLGPLSVECKASWTS